MTAAARTDRLVAVTELGERLAPLRLADAPAMAAMRASLRQHGQLSPLRGFEQDGVLEVFDGFKRLRAARGLGLRDLRVVVAEVDVIDATVQMRELHAGRGLTALEEAWIVRALHRDHHVSQGAIAARLRCHKSWVCRRLVLVEALDMSLQADVRLGLLAPRAAVLVAALPRGNQCAAAGVVIRRGLTVRQTSTFVRELADAIGPAQRDAALARWSKWRPPTDRPRGRTVRSVAETIALDVTTMQRTAGRLQACLVTMDPAAGVFRESLGALAGALRALSRTIADVMARSEIA